MAVLSVTITDELIKRFDAWAGAHGGRSPALRNLVDQACKAGVKFGDAPGRLKRARYLSYILTLSETERQKLDAAAAVKGLTSCAWIRALVRWRLSSRPTFSRPDEVSLITIQTELRRIRMNLNQIARASSMAMDNRAFDLVAADLDNFRSEIRVHMLALRKIIMGNLDYWADKYE